MFNNRFVFLGSPAEEALPGPIGNTELPAPAKDPKAKKSPEEIAAEQTKRQEEAKELKQEEAEDREKDVAKAEELIEDLDVVKKFEENKDAILKVLKSVETYQTGSGDWALIQEKLPEEFAKDGKNNELIKGIQRYLNIDPDGKVGPQTIESITEMLGDPTTVEWVEAPEETKFTEEVSGEVAEEKAVEAPVKAPEEPVQEKKSFIRRVAEMGWEKGGEKIAAEKAAADKAAVDQSSADQVGRQDHVEESAKIEEEAKEGDEQHQKLVQAEANLAVIDKALEDARAGAVTVEDPSKGGLSELLVNGKKTTDTFGFPVGQPGESPKWVTVPAEQPATADQAMVPEQPVVEAEQPVVAKKAEAPAPVEKAPRDKSIHEILKDDQDRWRDEISGEEFNAVVSKLKEYPVEIPKNLEKYLKMSGMYERVPKTMNANFDINKREKEAMDLAKAIVKGMRGDPNSKLLTVPIEAAIKKFKIKDRKVRVPVPHEGDIVILSNGMAPPDIVVYTGGEEKVIKIKEG